MKYGLLVVLAVIVSSCAVDSANNTAAMQDDPSKGIICVTEVPVGSSIKQKRCTTPEQRDLLRRQEEQLQTAPAPGGH